MTNVSDTLKVLNYAGNNALEARARVHECLPPLGYTFVWPQEHNGLTPGPAMQAEFDEASALIETSYHTPTPEGNGYGTRALGAPEVILFAGVALKDLGADNPRAQSLLEFARTLAV